jgi:heptosyltransferase-2
MPRLVILAPNWLGDAVMALPAIADVRRGLTAAHITVAARAAVVPLFQLVADVDDTIVLGRGASLARVGSWGQMGAELRNHGFATALLLPNSIHAALLAYRAGIRERWGYGGGVRAQWLTRAVPRIRGGHQADYYRHLVAALGFSNGDREPRISVPEPMRAAAEQLLRDAGWNGSTPLVALAPGAAYGGAKRWPPERFGELAARLAADGVAAVLIGSAADSAAAAEVAAAFRSHAGSAAAPHDLTGRTDLPALAGVLQRCRALVTNDSGAMHLAAAAGVPVTAVFGPTNEKATHPIGADHAVVVHPVWCRPCMLRECPIDHRCMRGIDVGTVVDHARRLIR